MQQREYQKGQMLLIIIIVVAALLISLTIGAGTVVKVRTASDEANAQQALNAAEAGVALGLEGTAIPTPSPIGSTGNITMGPVTITTNQVTPSFFTTCPRNCFLINDGEPIQQDEGADIWLVNHDSTSNVPNYSSEEYTDLFLLYWGSPTAGDCNNAALEVIIIQNPTSGTIPAVTRNVYDPCPPTGGTRRTNNHFSPPTSYLSPSQSFTESDGTTIKLAYQANVPVAKGYIMRVVPLYGNAQVGVHLVISRFCPTCSANPLPIQYSVITSTGTAGSTVKKLKVVKGYPKIPLEFFYNAYLPTTQ